MSLAGAAEHSHEFTLLTNHAHVLVVIAQKPDVRMREIATVVGITERAVQRIVDDLTATGYLIVTKDGRRNRYQVQPELPLRHRMDRHRTVGDLIRFFDPQFGFSERRTRSRDQTDFVLAPAEETEEVLL
jgi:MarR family